MSSEIAIDAILYDEYRKALYTITYYSNILFLTISVNNGDEWSEPIAIINNRNYISGKTKIKLDNTTKSLYFYPYGKEINKFNFNSMELDLLVLDLKNPVIPTIGLKNI
jgi:hypothetical protein